MPLPAIPQRVSRLDSARVLERYFDTVEVWRSSRHGPTRTWVSIGSATRTRAGYEAAIRNSLCGHRLLQETLEELPRVLAAARVESERELVQVITQAGPG